MIVWNVINDISTRNFIYTHPSIYHVNKQSYVYFVLINMAAQNSTNHAHRDIDRGENAPEEWYKVTGQGTQSNYRMRRGALGERVRRIIQANSWKNTRNRCIGMLDVEQGADRKGTRIDIV